MMSQREAYKELAVLVGFLVIMFWGACEGLSGGLVGSLGGLLRVFWEVSTYTPMMVLTVCTTLIQIHS